MSLGRKGITHLSIHLLIQCSFPSWSNVGEAIGNPRHTVDDSNRECGIELPGNYIDRFTEPKPELYPHFVRLLPQVRLGLLGNSCGLRVQALANDGRIYPIHIERRLPSQINLSTCTAKVSLYLIYMTSPHLPLALAEPFVRYS